MQTFDYRALGYSEAQNYTLNTLSIDSKNVTNEVVRRFKNQNEETSFSEYVWKHYDEVLKAYRGMTDADAPGSGGILRRMVRGMARPAVKAKTAAVENMPCPEPADSCMCVSEPSMCGMAMPTGAPAFTGGAGLMAAAAQPAPGESPEFPYEQLRTDTYEQIEPGRFLSVEHNPTSTFRPTYNTAAAGTVINNLKRKHSVEPSSVRTEELLNYANYDLKAATERKFEVTTELKKDDDGYLFFGVKGTEVIPTKQNIVLLLDVSGSMSSKEASMIQTVFAIVSRMNNGDILSLITYSSDDTLVFKDLVIDREHGADDIILYFFEHVWITGCTYGSKGIESAYSLVRKNKIADGINRVILMTDGDLNFGVTSTDGLKELVLENKKSGAYLSVIGMGLFNLQDDNLEALAKNGNGNYITVNSGEDVMKSVVGRYCSLVFPIARDVKIQVEFNPEYVREYLLVGYENRMLNHEDFRNDEVIAEPFGSGSYAVALYKIKWNKNAELKNDLKFQKKEVVHSDLLASLTVRYRLVDSEEIEEAAFDIPCEEHATGNIEKAIRIAGLADELRENHTVSRVDAEILEQLFD